MVSIIHKHKEIRISLDEEYPEKYVISEYLSNNEKEILIKRLSRAFNIQITEIINSLKIYRVAKLEVEYKLTNNKKDYNNSFSISAIERKTR